MAYRVFRARQRLRSAFRLAAMLLPLALLPGRIEAADSGNPEQFRVELTGAAWLLNSSGFIQASGEPINLVTDLGAGQQQPTFYGRLVIKPGRKHRIVVEGTPIRLSGLNTVDRTVTYHGQTFSVNETLRSSASLDYLFVGYQYDVLSGPAGHLGISVGGAYVSTTGVINAVEAGTRSSASETFGLPLAGAEGRLFPLRSHKWVQVEGGIRGMGLGDYGSYLEMSGSGGAAVGSFALMAGYRRVHADIHSTSATNPEGVNAYFTGPIFSAQWRW